jgi:hypothetical protein
MVIEEYTYAGSALPSSERRATFHECGPQGLVAARGRIHIDRGTRLRLRLWLSKCIVDNVYYVMMLSAILTLSVDNTSRISA